MQLATNATAAQSEDNTHLTYHSMKINFRIRFLLEIFMTMLQDFNHSKTLKQVVFSSFKNIHYLVSQ